MNQSAWETITGTLDQLTAGEKLELMERLAHSLRAQPPARAPEQKREALNRLRQELAALPVVNPAAGFAGRDHDHLLYGDHR
ncbi:MAG: hypothetical protein L0Z62_45765 [Gemmataceae bacterium]|nr:hypothetical protein [Gemmataceae bacterium]